MSSSACNVLIAIAAGGTQYMEENCRRLPYIGECDCGVIQPYSLTRFLGGVMDRDEQRELAVNTIRKVRDGDERRGSKSRNRRGRAQKGGHIYTHGIYSCELKFLRKSDERNSVCKKSRKHYIVPIPIQAVFLLSVNCVLSYI
jgi:hypothetical protein